MVGGAAAAGAGRGRTLVFARDVAAANEAADSLFVSGLPVMVYHRGVPAAERDAALQTLARCLSFQRTLQLASSGLPVRPPRSAAHLAYVLATLGVTQKHGITRLQVIGVEYE